MMSLSRLMSRAPAPVFPAIGPGRQADVERLLSRSGLRAAATPRDAAILLVAGDIPGTAAAPLARVHDQIPRPRVTVSWGHDEPDAIAARIAEAWREVCAGGEGEGDRLPDEPPNKWKGVGPNGQGGKGMMGGVPYGRPMAMTGPDIRDGLQLDRYTARFGPFAPMLPPGLVLEVTLQGDVICDVTVETQPFAQPADADAPDLCAARMLRLLGLAGPADRATAGKKPRGVWMRGAVPGGLGSVDGAGDARDRLSRWLSGTPVTASVPDIPALLKGAEWSEAMLILASLPPSAILRACQTPEAA